MRRPAGAVSNPPLHNLFFLVGARHCLALFSAFGAAHMWATHCVAYKHCHRPGCTLGGSFGEGKLAAGAALGSFGQDATDC